MQQVFLSFTYAPHPEHVEETELLCRRVSIVIESMDLRIVTGEDLGGEAISNTVKSRIEQCDALVALVTPWRDAAGQKVEPPWVRDEYNFAQARDKRTIRLMHPSIAASGMYKASEYIAVDPAEPTDALLKLMRTLALWKREGGRPMNIEITPDREDSRFEPAKVRDCQFKLFINYRESDWRTATVWPQPGALYAHLPNVPEDAKLRLKLRVGDETWMSAFHNPVGRVLLSRSDA